MAKKKTVKKTKKKRRGKPKAKPKKQRKAELEKATIEIGSMQTDIKSFIEKFKEDISKKRKSYLSFAQKLQRKRK